MVDSRGDDRAKAQYHHLCTDQQVKSVIVMVTTIVLLGLVATCFCVTNYNAKWNPPKEETQIVVELSSAASDKVVNYEAKMEIELSHMSGKQSKHSSADGPAPADEPSAANSNNKSEERKSYVVSNQHIFSQDPVDVAKNSPLNNESHKSDSLPAVRDSSEDGA